MLVLAKDVAIIVCRRRPSSLQQSETGFVSDLFTLKRGWFVFRNFCLCPKEYISLAVTNSLHFLALRANCQFSCASRQLMACNV